MFRELKGTLESNSLLLEKHHVEIAQKAEIEEMKVVQSRIDTLPTKESVEIMKSYMQAEMAQFSKDNTSFKDEHLR
jgi:hypothetical protein